MEQKQRFSDLIASQSPSGRFSSYEEFKAAADQSLGKRKTTKDYLSEQAEVRKSPNVNRILKSRTQPTGVVSAIAGATAVGVGGMAGDKENIRDIVDRVRTEKGKIDTRVADGEISDVGGFMRKLGVSAAAGGEAIFEGLIKPAAKFILNDKQEQWIAEKAQELGEDVLNVKAGNIPGIDPLSATRKLSQEEIDQEISTIEADIATGNLLRGDRQSAERRLEELRTGDAETISKELTIGEWYEQLSEDEKINLRAVGGLAELFGASRVAKSLVGKGSQVTNKIGIGEATEVQTTNLFQADIPTIESVNRDAFKAGNQILQVGNKMDEVGRSSEFANSVRQFTKIIGESDTKINSFQEGLTFVQNQVKDIKTKRATAIEPFKNNQVDVNDYLLNLKGKIDEMKSSAFSKADAQGYEQVYLEAVSDITGKSIDDILEEGVEVAIANAPKKTVADMLKLNEMLNKDVNELYTLGGIKDLPDNKKVRLQALEELRRGSRRQILENTSDEVGQLNNQISGLIDAQTLLKIQRGRANKALDEINWKDWSVATKLERAQMVKDYLPFVSDLGRGQLTMLDSKSKVGEAMLDLNIRRIRGSYKPFTEKVQSNNRPKQNTENTVSPMGETPATAQVTLEQPVDVPDKNMNAESQLESQSSQSIVPEASQNTNKLDALPEKTPKANSTTPKTSGKIEGMKNLETEAKKYKSADEFIAAQPKVYRGQEKGASTLSKNKSSNTSKTVGEGYYFTTDKKLAEKYGEVQEIPFSESNTLTVKDIDKIIKDAQTELDKLVKNEVYEGELYDRLEDLSIGDYPMIAKHIKKPFIRTGRYDDTEILYYPEFDKTTEQLKDIWRKANKK